MSTKIAVVTGGNRGIGFEACRQLASHEMRVVLASRDEAKGRAAAEQLRGEGLAVIAHPLDVVDPGSIAAIAAFLRQEFGQVDVLVNNAGIYLDQSGDSILSAQVDTVRQTMETNVYGPLQLCQAIVPLMKEHHYGRIVNVSSGAGQLHDMSAGHPAYRMSKTALNALTRVLAAELDGTNILVNSVCPGWVKTDMGGANAPRTPAQGADTITWLATLPEGGPSGGFFRDRQPIEW
ncbi:SDR family oxidoreductase [Oculatella sp. LEGE 06141]|uniref:SDR family oxidoreductase n=1 Tax=Oculatella sp. LEGE 06141 TaxID=1828648 RepID=UPI00188190FB|nr:SDR family oxidoreductase [Oculatella sp. LEGE 06141]MBE9177896.1 SDR family oxidoreductase [Oculatella sp. LEGE 06141]